jgi:hypothetical protein
MEICPKCHDYTLSYDPSRKVALCYSHACDYEMSVTGLEEYFKNYVISELNWENYCAKTPIFVRKLRGTLEPSPAT